MMQDCLCLPALRLWFWSTSPTKGWCPPFWAFLWGNSYDCITRVPNRFFNPVIPTKSFPQSRNPDGLYQLIPIPNIRFTEVPYRGFNFPHFGELVKDGGITESGTVTERHVTGSRKMWATCVVKMKGFLTFRYRISVHYNNISRISHRKTAKSRIPFIFTEEEEEEPLLNLYTIPKLAPRFL